MSTWRDKHKVHPAADVFPMMSDEELRVLGEDIKANGLKEPISVHYPNGLRGEPILLDGRNRLEAMERVGLSTNIAKRPVHTGDPVAYVISANILRRHLTKAKKADLIVAVHKATEAENISRQDGEKIRGRPIDKVKAAAIATAKALPTPISERTIERAFAKAEGKMPAAVTKYTAKPMPKPKSGKPVVGIDAVRQCYLDRCAEPDVDLDAEQEIIIDALRENLRQAGDAGADMNICLKQQAEQQDLLTSLGAARERREADQQIADWCLELRARLERAEAYLLDDDCRRHHATLATEIERLRLCIRLARERKS